MITREEAWKLLTEFNKDPFHLRHALTVEGAMRHFARTRDMRRKKTSGAWWACSTIWILNNIRTSTAQNPRRSCGNGGWMNG